MGEEPKYHCYEATHSAWFLLAPIYLANLDEDVVTVLARRCPVWWVWFNIWLSVLIRGAAECCGRPSAVGCLFYSVKELKDVKQISARALVG